MTTTTVGQNANIKSVKISLSVSKWLLPIFQGAPRTSALAEKFAFRNCPERQQLSETCHRHSGLARTAGLGRTKTVVP